MGWFRSKSCIGSGLALFALVLQFALSFGHVHAAVSGNGSSSYPSACHSSAMLTAAPDAPGVPLGDLGFADDCAICATIHLTGSLLPAEPPSWPLPANLVPELARREAHSKLTAWLRRAFRARAPPFA